MTIPFNVILSRQRLVAGIRRYRSALILIAANMIPLWGVFFHHWSAFNVVFLFWAENVVIGVINLPKMLLAEGGVIAGTAAKPSSDPDFVRLREAFIEREKMGSQQSGTGTPSISQTVPPAIVGVTSLISRIFMTGFFIFHYGMFCRVHGEFVFEFLNHSARSALPQGPGLNLFGGIVDMLRFGWQHGLAIALSALAISRLYSFVANYILGREYRYANPNVLMFEPYARIALIHIVLLAGGALSLAFKNSVPIVALLVIFKIFMDLALHVGERAKRAGTAATASGNPA